MEWRIESDPSGVEYRQQDFLRRVGCQLSFDVRLQLLNGTVTKCGWFLQISIEANIGMPYTDINLYCFSNAGKEDPMEASVFAKMLSDPGKLDIKKMGYKYGQENLQEFLTLHK